MQVDEMVKQLRETIGGDVVKAGFLLDDAARFIEQQDQALRALQAEREAVDKAMGHSTRFMFPPDGGDPTQAEMVANMRQQLDKAEARTHDLTVAVDNWRGLHSDTKAALAEAVAEREAIKWLEGEPEWWDTPREFRDMVSRAHGGR